jgi:flagellar protein FlbT
MPLTITLQPGQEIVLNGPAVISNGSPRSIKLRLQNEVPFLLKKEVLSADEANTPMRRAYFALQCMYLDPTNRDEHKVLFTRFTDELLEVTRIPELRGAIESAIALSERERFPQGLRALRAALPLEEALLSTDLH